MGGSPGERKGYPLQYYDLENSGGSVVHGGHRESDTPERLSPSLHFQCNLNGKKEIEGFDELGGGGLVVKLCLTLTTSWAVASQDPLSIGFPGNLPNTSLLHCEWILYS